MAFLDIFGVSPRGMAGKLRRLNRINDKFESRLVKFSERAAFALTPVETQDLHLIHNRIREILPSLDGKLREIDMLESTKNPSKQVLDNIDVHIDQAISKTSELRELSLKLVRLSVAAKHNIESHSFAHDSDYIKHTNVVEKFRNEAREFLNELESELKLEHKLEKKENRR